MQKLGLESPSDPEIRVAAYRGLVRCLPSNLQLLETVENALNPSHDAYSTQGEAGGRERRVGSYSVVGKEWR